MIDARAATDPADQDPDLLTTRIQNLRSGYVKKMFYAKFSTKNLTFVVCSTIFDTLSSLKAD